MDHSPFKLCFSPSDAELLCSVAGEKNEFNSLPQQNHCKITNKFFEQENVKVPQAIKQLLAKEIIVESRHEQVEFISLIFIRPKPDGSHRLILNRKKVK